MSPTMTPPGSSIVAVYPNHDSAKSAIQLLHKNGFAIEDLSIIGRNIQMSEEPTGFVSTGDYVKAGAKSGALIGGLAGVAPRRRPAGPARRWPHHCRRPARRGCARRNRRRGWRRRIGAARRSARRVGGSQGTRREVRNPRCKGASSWCSHAEMRKKSPAPRTAQSRVARPHRGLRPNPVTDWITRFYTSSRIGRPS